MQLEGVFDECRRGVFGNSYLLLFVFVQVANLRLLHSIGFKSYLLLFMVL